MKRETIIIRVPRYKHRAVELYHDDSPYWPKIEQNKKAYRRKPKHSKEFFSE